MGQSISPQLVAAIFVACLATCWKILGSFLHGYLTRKMTVLYDLPKLGIPRPDHSRILGTAVIVGGSIAGLWTARICADHFEEVLVIEPELWTSGDEGTKGLYDKNGVLREGISKLPRQRIPQYTAAHGYQPVQLRALRRLLPEFEAEVKNIDGRILPGEYNMHAFGGHVMRLPVDGYESKKDLECFFLSRESYERTLRGLVRKYSGRIQWLSGTATGMKTVAWDTSLLETVVVRTHEGHEKEIPASLVIDCSGPSQVGLKWLKRVYHTEALTPRAGSLPFDDIKLEYKTSQRYQIHRIHVPPAARPILPIPGGYDNAGFIYMIMPKPGIEKCVLIIGRVEGHRIEFAFGGWANPPIPATVHDIRDYLINLGGDEPVPAWLLKTVDILLEHEGATESVIKTLPELSWTRFEQSPYIPSNFIAIGDSVMNVNPTYGQGCSKAAIGAITLDGLLRAPRYRTAIQIPANFGLDFFKRHKHRIAGAWDGTKPMDYQWDSTIPVKGEALSDENFMAKYASIVMQIAKNDDKVDAALWRVRCFLGPPTDLLHPSIIAKVTLFWLRQQFGR